MDFDNIFDENMSDADAHIIETMGRNVRVVINGIAREVRGVFDHPEANTTLPKGAALVEDIAPTLFVKTADIQDLRKRDAIQIGNDMYWVTLILPDDIGVSVVRLARGEKRATLPDIDGNWS